MRLEPSGDFGLIGLAVMGQNLIMNAADHGFTVVAFNRTVSKVDRFLDNEAKGTHTYRVYFAMAADQMKANQLLALILSKNLPRS